jgi:serine/threonine-protein kinase PpkA
MEIPGYQIDRRIGKGGMATVYLATQTSLSRPVVLKILDIPKDNEHSNQIERFLSEGRIVASLNHPNIITIYDIGVTDDNALYISMEYIKGGDLKSRIGIPMSPEEALDILINIGFGLKTAHEHGVIHRDVKPANILFRDDDTPLLTDFGIAKQVDNDLNLTSTGVFLGSPNYVSPEQADGKDVDCRTDIYSLGCIFYEMLTGEKPFKSETLFDVVNQHKNAPIPLLPEDVQDCQPLLNLMMAKSPHDRFANADEMIEYIKILQGKLGPSMSRLDFDITLSSGITISKNKRTFIILMVLLGVSSIFFMALQFVDVRLKRPAVNLDAVTVNTTLGENLTMSAAPESDEPISEDVINALIWLGNQSLEEYKLTYPPKDNAYYYFSRLLEINPQSDVARRGILEIADRYALLAEKTLAANDYGKTQAYVDIGLKINPRNETLLSLKQLSEETRQISLVELIKGFFN